MTYSDFRIFDFKVYDSEVIEDSSDNSSTLETFQIQIFAINEKRETASIIAQNFTPFFYVCVPSHWRETDKTLFLEHIVKKYKLPSTSILNCRLIKARKLYGFDNRSLHVFIRFDFANMNIFHKTKNIWYKEGKLLKYKEYIGYSYKGAIIQLYESNIPPLLRFFHMKDISPSGWISVPVFSHDKLNKKTHCKYEFVLDYKEIIPLNDKETRVPFKIMSFDIEASSSHGDFPIPVKSYKKLATNIIDYWERARMYTMEDAHCKKIFTQIILSAFHQPIFGVDKVYPKYTPTNLEEKIKIWLDKPIKHNFHIDETEKIFEKFYKLTFSSNEENEENENMDESEQKIDEDIEEEIDTNEAVEENNEASVSTIIDILRLSCKREIKIDYITNAFHSRERKDNLFPELEGDKTTFIGSTFMYYGEKQAYKNHCIVLNSCSRETDDNTIIETYKTEKEVLLAWKNLVQREDPDIIIGYNIFNFDYTFLFKRAEENKCVEEFLQLSRNQDEICGVEIKENGVPTGKYKLEESSIILASGPYDIRYIKMPGRLQIDLYNYYRRVENLPSYKLDYVAGYFIGDYVKSITPCDSNTQIYTGNMTGLMVGSFIHFEEIDTSTEYYNNGEKYQVLEVCLEKKWFIIQGKVDFPYPPFRIEDGREKLSQKKVRWCLAKDDVSPKDIFRLTNGSAEDRRIIAKYCIQDCNLLHYLLNKTDILTGYIEMAKICNVPISFLIMRGQGIKLTSCIAKECYKNSILIPVIEKKEYEAKYEGAIVLEPKTNLYLNNPVACVDYAGLYPSSMISENLSHDTKVWTKEFDLDRKLTKEWGEKNEKGQYKYDNLKGREYVDIEYDINEFCKIGKKKAEKVKVGYKVCRFIQPYIDEKGNTIDGIIPSILKKLLKARKDTRKLIPNETDPFMQSVLEQRQLGYKVTANSLYGGCGAPTSTFCEKDIAACTTATGRKLLTYAKRVIEETYHDRICETRNYGAVLTKAEYIYGDSVADYTPIYIRINGNIHIMKISQIAKKYGDNKWVLNDTGKEFCEMPRETLIETWTDKGWTPLLRVIRHHLAPNKKMVRIQTDNGLVDVTDDHSLLLTNGESISPKDLTIGTKLLHKSVILSANLNARISQTEAQIMGYFYVNGSIYTSNWWCLLNIPSNLCEMYLQLCKNEYKEFTWKICPAFENKKKVYNILPLNSTETILTFIDRYRMNFYDDDRNKIIPYEILNSSAEIHRAFFKGVCDAYGYDYENKDTMTFYETSFISAANIYCLCQNLHYFTYICTTNNIFEDNHFQIIISKNCILTTADKITKMDILPSGRDGLYVYDLTTRNNHFAAGIGNMIVHNTDSVFFTFNLHTLDGKQILDKKALEITIELAQQAGHLASSFLKQPHDLEYEKTFMPFCLLAKKKYVGMLYETDPNKSKRKEMGIVLKRRDNAPIVKDIYGEIINILMKEQNIQKAIQFLGDSLEKIVNGTTPIDKLIITKSLRSDYKCPNSIAHKVLADRIGLRDAGNKPSPGDRIPFVHFVPKNMNKKTLQGDKIETPNFILENKLVIDYEYYITNQIMKPLQQLFSLVLEDIWKMQNKIGKLKRFKDEVELLKKDYITDYVKFQEKLLQKKNDEVQALLFQKYLTQSTNKKQGITTINKYFTKK